MNIGKREQIVGVSIGTLVAIALIHMFIFKPKSEEYDRVESEYKQAVATLATAERPPSPNYLSQFKVKTQQYSDQITSVVAQLDLDKPPHYEKAGAENINKRLDEAVGLLSQLLQLRLRVTTPRLSFLDDRRAVQNELSPQEGWNLPPQLPNVGAQGALWDVIVKISEQWRLMNNIQDPRGYMDQRLRYNALLRTIGINPAEVSDWVVNHNGQYVFFNDQKWVGVFGNAAVPNPLSINRFGPVVPSLKKLWICELIWQKRDPRSPITKERLREVLEVNIPTGPTLLQTTKQLRALIEIIGMAQRRGIMEMTRVNLIKPIPIEKSFQRQPGVVPTPAATPTPAAGTVAGDPMMFGDPTLMGGGGGMAPTPTPATQAIGMGTGLELWFRGDNKQIVEFLFDISHSPRTYAVDDLSIRAIPNQPLETSATVEIVTALDSIKK